MNVKVARNDIVQALSGRDRGKKGKVLRVIVKKDMVLVEGVNFCKKAMRRTQQNQQGGIIDIERPLHISSVGVVCPKCNKPVKVGMKKIKDRGKLRICRKCGEVLEVKI